ncbi:glycoside hydrolase superfamily [Chaetomium tenue]|uniref:Glycoside hydrolase superfamily n=1 Tax=Chaetomium tenue TaxID=1854479 RepID=A0ACB7NXU3_9PEZI|nr:glycoside hydrolase superfamily [Chaetomium globosum]
MKRATSLLTAGLSISGSLAQVDVPSNFVPGVKWQIIIQNTLDVEAALQPTDAVVWDLDLYHVARTPEIVTHLRNNDPDAILICYFNAGLAQESDCDYDTKWKNSGLLGNIYSPDEPDFSDERWVNIKNQTARDWMKDRITLARDYGCDGVDPDNIDGYLNDLDNNNGTGWNLSEGDYVSFVTELATHAHSLTTDRGHTLLIGQKNAPELVEQIGGDLDFAVLEDCKTLNDDEDYVFCGDFQTYIAEGKPVFSIEYPSTLGNTETGACNANGASDEQYAASCATDQGNSGFSTVLKIQGGEGELNGCTQYCSGGEPGTGVVVTPTDPGSDGNTCPSNSTS